MKPTETPNPLPGGVPAGRGGSAQNRVMQGEFPSGIWTQATCVYTVDRIRREYFSQVKHQEQEYEVAKEDG
ncbi:MAG: hypothetical protein HC851_20660 [Acaryochloris sp. RU_4_1]|nr:hypothetical protein [Acaryochloris sp. RU_4_1]